ncbi:MAG: hypothetical protein WAM60_06710 [Candidatus Promineifilaceae bacterium]
MSTTPQGALPFVTGGPTRDSRQSWLSTVSGGAVGVGLGVIVGVAVGVRLGSGVRDGVGVNVGGRVSVGVWDGTAVWRAIEVADSPCRQAVAKISKSRPRNIRLRKHINRLVGAGRRGETLDFPNILPSRRLALI